LNPALPYKSGCPGYGPALISLIVHVNLIHFDSTFSNFRNTKKSNYFEVKKRVKYFIEIVKIAFQY
jgi:hypothetical protein